ncbi:MAG: hypothetical protein JWO00_354 [Candidatus Parcubacteria bacterium]|nr:hypothetical protein [Candidatus Parcubacteria bacterium]
MKIINIILRVVLCLLILTPILGAIGIFPAPTPDLYNTPEAFAFINMLFMNGYVLYIMALVFAVCIVLIIMNRMALASLLIAPIVVNIVSFHAFLDGGLFTSGASLAIVLLVLNIYFLWQSRAQYKSLWNKA